MPILYAFLASFLLTALLVPLVCRLARARGVYAHPTYDRWHRHPVPNVGGVAMLVPVLVVSVAAGLVTPLGPLLLASSLMFVLGLVDDLSPVRPASKLVGQMLIAAVLLYLLPPVRIFGAPTLDLAIAFVWVVGITNAVNLLDNIDGLAAGIAGIAGVFFVLVLWIDQPGAIDPLTIAVSALVGAACAFLIYNFHPASIFMGDGGSHLLGSFLAGATLMALPRLDTHLAPVSAIPIVLLLIPIFDTIFVTVLRRMSGRSAFLGGRDHTSHRLVALGIGERRAVLVLYALAAVGGALALGLATLPSGLAWGLVGLYVMGLALVGFYLGHVDVRPTSRDTGWQPLPSEVAVRHRAFEVVVDAVLLGAAYYLAFVVRFRAPQFDEFLPYFTRSVPLVIASQVAALWLSGKYRRVSARLGPGEIIDLARRAVLGVGASVIAVLYVSRFEGYSRSVFAVDAVFAPVLVVGARIAASQLDAYLRLRRSRGRTALVYGAGRTGRLALRELLHDSALALTPIGFIDDDAKPGTRVDGFPVLGSLDHLPALLDRMSARPNRVAAIVVAVADLPRSRSEQLTAICGPRDISVRRIRLALEDVRPAGPGNVVRFPGA